MKQQTPQTKKFIPIHVKLLFRIKKDGKNVHLHLMGIRCKYDFTVLSGLA
jgi:hypothetical protein